MVDIGAGNRPLHRRLPGDGEAGGRVCGSNRRRSGGFRKTWQPIWQTRACSGCWCPDRSGALELDFIEYLRIVDIFARADGSVAWCVNQNNVFATDSVRMPNGDRAGDLGRSPGGYKQRPTDAAKLRGRNRRRLPGHRPLELQQRYTPRQLGRGANPLGPGSGRDTG